MGGFCALDEYMVDWKHARMEVVVIGASLTGLTFALACARRGISTRVVDRVEDHHRGGAALGIDRNLVWRVTGATEPPGTTFPPFPPLTIYRSAASWQAVHEWLFLSAAKCKEVTLSNGVTISEVHQSEESATATTASGERVVAPIIVGADGYRSIVRKAISPDRGDASYAGYMLWRGLVHEADLPLGTAQPKHNDGVALTNVAGYRLIAYPVAGFNGSLEPGERLISFAWYDAGRESLLRDLHCLSSAGNVLASVSPDNVPETVREELTDSALRMWPDPWKAAIIYAVEHRQVFGTPVAEYLPDRLHSGRLAIIGDAAHVASPVTGRGFAAGILDAESLADCLQAVLGETTGSVFNALQCYEERRLAEAQTLVAKSLDWSRAYLRGLGRP